ncbi:MAG TPA: SDR family oxidoreductase [Solirubrobacteraceae bacterium]|jgi:NAD(P)-dependent dehydrogenase (short-subunit alcohol dehydrogenase family)|nr:SDR family oxidoreductase [Solirubrobacteraceae bacterium]
MPQMVVAVTGASSGVGRATAHAFAREGATVGLLARGAEALDAAAAEVRAIGGTPVVLRCDVADADAVDAAASELEQHGEIDVWVNDAMASVFAPTWEITAAEFKRVTEVTYLGVVNGTLSALARMLARDRGVIVQVGSALAYRGIPLQSPYCASKHAIQGFTESLRCELMHENSGVRVTMVQLPAVNTPQFDTVRTRLPRHPQPVPPIYQPEVAARAIFTAATHPRRREWWVGGSTMITLLGNAVAPGIGDRYLARTGFDSQQTEEPVAPDRPDNLYDPVAGPGATHGDFDQQAKGRSLQWAATRHRRIVAALACAGAVAGIAAVALRRR